MVEVTLLVRHSWEFSDEVWAELVRLADGDRDMAARNLLSEEAPYVNIDDIEICDE